MPLVHLQPRPDALWGVWHATEDEHALAATLVGENAPFGITNPQKRLEFLAARALLRTLLAEWAIPFQGVYKDACGKPFLKGIDAHISLTHSYPYVAAVVHRRHSVGIDLEQPKAKLLKIAPRILAPDELADAGADVVKHCIYWCAKESLIKIHGRKDLHFRTGLHVGAFVRAVQGEIEGRIITENAVSVHPLSYIVSENHVIVVSA